MTCFQKLQSPRHHVAVLSCSAVLSQSLSTVAAAAAAAAASLSHSASSLHSYRDINAESFHFPVFLPPKQPKKRRIRSRLFFGCFLAKHEKYSDFCIIKTTNAITMEFVVELP